MRPLGRSARDRSSEWYHQPARMSSSGDDHRRGVPSGLMIQIDARAPEGLQRQVYSAVRRRILDGLLEPGTRLPSSRGLADDLRVSRTTTLLAYEQLLAEGYLKTRRGSGTFVAEELPDDLPRPALLRRVARTKHPPLSR